MITIDYDSGLNIYSATLDGNRISVILYPPFSNGRGQEVSFEHLEPHIQNKITEQLREAIRLRRDLERQEGGCE
jgi:hypothetical protein